MAAGDLTATKGTMSERICSVFDGVDDNILVTSNDQLNMGTEDFCISFWINNNQAISDDVVSKRSGSGPADPGMILGVAGNGKFFVEIEDDSLNEVALLTAGDARTGTWNHIVYLFDRSGNVSTYVNNSLDGNTADISSVGTISNAVNLYIGRNGVAARIYEGGIRDVRIYKGTLLTAAQIDDVYNGKTSSADEGFLVGRWKLEDDYTDSSTWGNDGTNTGSYLTNTGAKKVLADMNDLNLAATTDKLICVGIPGRDGLFRTWKAEREA
jgi:hypothetical protein